MHTNQSSKAHRHFLLSRHQPGSIRAQGCLRQLIGTINHNSQQNHNTHDCTQDVAKTTAETPGEDGFVQVEPRVQCRFCTENERRGPILG